LHPWTLVDLTSNWVTIQPPVVPEQRQRSAIAQRGLNQAVLVARRGRPGKLAAGPPVPLPRPPGLFGALGAPRHAGEPAQTLRPLARAPARGALGAGPALSGPQEGGLISTRPLPYPKIPRSLCDRSAPAGLNRKLSRCWRPVAAGF